MRNHPDFIPELDFVAVHGGKIIGNIMYTKSRLIDENGECFPTITFGPISVLPDHQRKGIGSALIRHSIRKAVSLGQKAIIIEGYPHDYCKHGFKCCRDFSVSDGEGKFPLGLLVLELSEGCLLGHKWKTILSNVFIMDESKAAEYDESFPPKKKEYRYSQEEFRIASHAFVE